MLTKEDIIVGVAVYDRKQYKIVGATGFDDGGFWFDLMMDGILERRKIRVKSRTFTLNLELVGNFENLMIKLEQEIKWQRE